MSELDWLDDEERELIADIENQTVYFKSLTEKLTNEDKFKELEIKQLSKNILGCRVCCDCMCGMVVSVDDNCYIYIELDNGSTLVINPEVDEFTILEGKDNENR